MFLTEFLSPHFKVGKARAICTTIISNQQSMSSQKLCTTNTIKKIAVEAIAVEAKLLQKMGKFLLIFVVIFGWIFSGWPVIWQNPRIPPQIKKVLAALPGYRSSGTFTAGTGAITPPYPA